MDSVKNYSSISPSARSLLLLKGCTNIPYARQAAELMVYPESYHKPAESRTFDFWARVIHFENRYWSIDQLLNETGIKNVLELSSGYSFRGLDLTARKPVHYVDSDLEQVISLKQEFISRLRPQGQDLRGRLEMRALNALDEEQFREAVARFDSGPVVIVNEGLLMYLDEAEKKKLCRLIHQILKVRGGCWITADIYIRKPLSSRQIEQGEEEKKFFQQHRIEENKFESFESAESFFHLAGFKKKKKAVSDHGRLSVLPYLIESASADQLKRIQTAGRIQETWMLEAE